MIAHVAEASEDSGRVVMWLDPQSRCPDTIFDAPIRLAAAYGAEVETVAIALEDEDQALDVPVRRVAHVSTDTATTSVPESSHFALLTERQRRVIDQAAAARNVGVRHGVARGDAVDRIAEMCLARGPWNIVALPHVPRLGGHALISALLANVGGATGFLLCGNSQSLSAPRVAILVEDIDRLPSMLRSAERLTAEGGSIHLVIAGETAAECDELEEQARLLTAEQPSIVFASAGPTYGVPGALIEFLARLKPSFIIGRFGGSGFADGRDLSRASAATRAPILLVR